ncbi:MAG: Gfo/Idh/MocA family oxidoreductase [Pirellulales bacterium]
MNHPKSTCRFGILSTAGIARKNWKAMRLAGNACVAAVASRSLESANRFIDECSAEVPDSASRGILILRSTTGVGFDRCWSVFRHQQPCVTNAIKAAQAGKHVIGEKPAAINATQVGEMLDACRQHKVQYMDGVMFMHSQRLPLVRKLIEAGRSVSCRFGFAILLQRWS